jgi:anthranilate phosphoribosyltransferase
MIREAILLLTQKQNLSYDQSYAVLDEIMSGSTSQIQIAAFLTALAMKGETSTEIASCAAAMRDHATPVQVPFPVLEIVGTGGDGANSFNISSTASLVVAAAGVPVAKHGNRAASSQCGAADVLEALGVNLRQEPEQAAALLEQVGICFFFAQQYHASMKYVAPIRKELGIRTVFNFLGPLTNPAAPTYQVLGVCDEGLLEPMADVLSSLGVQRGLVVYNRSKMDEFSTCASNAVCEFTQDTKRRYEVTPQELGFVPCGKAELVGGTPAENAAITLDILSGQPGPRRDTVLLNAGAALYIAGKAASLADGIHLAAETVDSGQAAALLRNYAALSQTV